MRLSKGVVRCELNKCVLLVGFMTFLHGRYQQVLLGLPLQGPMGDLRFLEGSPMLPKLQQCGRHPKGLGATRSTASDGRDIERLLMGPKIQMQLMHLNKPQGQVVPIIQPQFDAKGDFSQTMES